MEDNKDLQGTLEAAGKQFGDSELLDYAKKVVEANTLGRTQEECIRMHEGECGTCRSGIFYPCV